MNTLYDPFPVDHREAWIPDLFDGNARYLTSTPGGCTCTKNYAHPHYMPCTHVRLLRTGFPLAGIYAATVDGARAYVLATDERYRHPGANGRSRPGMWRYCLYFAGGSVHVRATHVNTGFTSTEVLPPSRYAEWTDRAAPRRTARPMP